MIDFNSGNGYPTLWVDEYDTWDNVPWDLLALDLDAAGERVLLIRDQYNHSVGEFRREAMEDAFHLYEFVEGRMEPHPWVRNFGPWS